MLHLFPGVEILLSRCKTGLFGNRPQHLTLIVLQWNLNTYPHKKLTYHRFICIDVIWYKNFFLKFIMQRQMLGVIYNK